MAVHQCDAQNATSGECTETTRNGHGAALWPYRHNSTSVHVPTAIYNSEPVTTIFVTITTTIIPQSSALSSTFLPTRPSTTASSPVPTMPPVSFQVSTVSPEHWSFDKNAIISTVVGMFVCIVMIAGIFTYAFREMRRHDWKGPEDNYKWRWKEDEDLEEWELRLPRELRFVGVGMGWE